MNPTKSNVPTSVPSPVLSGNGFKPSIVLESDPAVAPSDGNDRAFPRDAAKYHDNYWELGWTDGRLGQPLEIAQAAVEWRMVVDRNERLADLQGRIAAATTKIASLKERIGTLPKHLASLREYQHQLQTAKFEDNYHASIPIGLLYTVVGLALFIADLPLSLQLVTRSLGIARQVGDVSVDQLFTSPLKVIFGPTWEAMFLAGGIAFSGMFVKYFLEEVILAQKGEGSANGTSSQEVSVARRRARLIVLTVIFVLFISTTIVLGIFRASAEAKLKSKKVDATFLLDPTQSTMGGLDSAASSNSAMSNEAEPSIFTLESLTFTLLTLMFPIVGGVCFSAGSRRLADGCRRVKKLLHYWRIRFSVFWIDKRYRPLQTNLTHFEEELCKLQELLKQEKDEATVKASKQLNLNLYKHGYMRGRTLPETLHVEERLYPQAKRVVEKLLARDLRTELWGDIKVNNLSVVTPKNPDSPHLRS